MDDLTTCRRCGQVGAQLDTEFLHWETSNNGSHVVCPGCITGDEQQAVDEDAMDFNER